MIQNGTSPPIHEAEQSLSLMIINFIDMELECIFVGFVVVIANSGNSLNYFVNNNIIKIKYGFYRFLFYLHAIGAKPNVNSTKEPLIFGLKISIITTALFVRSIRVDYIDEWLEFDFTFQRQQHHWSTWIWKKFFRLLFIMWIRIDIYEQLNYVLNDFVY